MIPAAHQIWRMINGKSLFTLVSQTSPQSAGGKLNTGRWWTSDELWCGVEELIHETYCEFVGWEPGYEPEKISPVVIPRKNRLERIEEALDKEYYPAQREIRN